MEATTIPNGHDNNYALGKKTMRFQSNAASIRRRVVALQSARERAIALQTERLTVSEILGEICRLRKTFPAIADEETRGPIPAMILGH